MIIDQLGRSDRYVVGMLGVLNGLLTSTGSRQVVAMKWEESEVGTWKQDLVGFVVVDQSPET